MISVSAGNRSPGSQPRAAHGDTAAAKTTVAQNVHRQRANIDQDPLERRIRPHPANHGNRLADPCSAPDATRITRDKCISFTALRKSSQAGLGSILIERSGLLGGGTPNRETDAIVAS